MLRDPGLIPLSHQHHNGLALCVMTRRALGGDSGTENISRLAKRIVDRFELEMINHFQLEEQVLFPAVDRQVGRLPIVGRLIAEHRELERLVSDIRLAPNAALLESFCALLTRHIRSEENELFQQIQEMLPREMLDSLGKIFEEQAVRICL